MASTGFQYYWNLLGLDSGSYKVHYDFNQSGVLIPSTQGASPLYSGSFLGSSSGFFKTSGSGYFSNQQINISNATGMPNSAWTHFFIYERTGSAQGILFTSMNSGNPSGYTIGISDNNKLYFENYFNQVPQVKMSTQTFGRKNAVAVVRSNNILTFHYYDYNINSIASQSYNLPVYAENYSLATLGGGNSLPSYLPNAQFSGYLDEYVYVSQALTPSNISVLFSGFYSQYINYPQTTGSSGYYAITGYSYQFTGVTGVTGYNISTSITGYDVFGDPIFSTTSTPLTGYIISGEVQTPLSGYIPYTVTGAQSGYVSVDKNFGLYFGLDTITYLEPVSKVSYLTLFSNYTSGLLNLTANYDRISTLFDVNINYTGNQLALYSDGAAQVENLNYNLSGFGISGVYDASDSMIYDALVLDNEWINIPAVASGQIENLSLSSPNNKLVFFNGEFLIQGIYYMNSGGKFSWLDTSFLSGNAFTNENIDTESFFDLMTENNINLVTENIPSGVVGILSAYTLPATASGYTGVSFYNLPTFQRNSSQLFVSGFRQQIGQTYVENSSMDLLKGSGLFENSLSSVYDDDAEYWE